MDKHFRLGAAERKPLVPLGLQLRGREPSALRMLGVVVVHLSVALETERKCVPDVVAARLRGVRGCCADAFQAGVTNSTFRLRTLPKLRWF